MDLSSVSHNLVLYEKNFLNGRKSFTDCKKLSSDVTSNSCRSSQPGDTVLVIKVEQMGFKDASCFIDPCITMSVVDKKGVVIEQMPDIPHSEICKPNYVVFNQKVQVSTPLRLLDQNFGFFFEFKHFKPKKKKVSTKAWCFLEMDEIGENKKVALEIYRKPTDFSRSQFNLLSIKPLFLHLYITLHRI